jgi:hypothetical protein
VAKETDWQLWRSNYPVHNSHIFSVLSPEVALFKVDEESPEACASHEGVTGKDQGDEAKRSSFKGIAG